MNVNKILFKLGILALLLILWLVGVLVFWDKGERISYWYNIIFAILVLSLPGMSYKIVFKKD